MKIRYLAVVLCCVLNFMSGCKADAEHKEIVNTIEEKEMAENKIRVTIEQMEFIATLEKNETAKKFITMLPLTIQMDELNGNEKYAYLADELSQEQASNPGIIYEGDIMCYSSDCLVVFYKTFSTGYSYVPIGHIDDTSKLKDTLKNDGVEITFELIKD